MYVSVLLIDSCFIAVKVSKREFFLKFGAKYDFRNYQRMFIATFLEYVKLNNIHTYYSFE
jgi:hypothetical protein